MLRVSPTFEGFRAALRNPSLTIGEITWRWSVGLTAIVLFFFGLSEYLRSLPVTNGELFFLRTRQPVLVEQAIEHILRGSLSRAVSAALLAAMLLALFWIVTASLGRIAIVESMLESVREELAKRKEVVGLTSENVRVSAPSGSRFRTLVRLNFLRVSIALAAILGLGGAAILAGFASPADHPSAGLVLLLFLPLAWLILFLWFALNWLLTLAAVFAVRDREDAIGAISGALRLCRERTAAVFSVGTWTGVAHFVAFVGANIIVFMALGSAAVLPGRLVALGVIFVTLAYFAVADWLYTVRLAGYVWIAELPDAFLAPLPPPITPPIVPPLQATIDRDEPILSDIPHPAPL